MSINVKNNEICISKMIGFILNSWTRYFQNFIVHTEPNIYINWIDDDDVARKISDKLKLAGAQGISFCNIAKKAQELGRKDLAIKVKCSDIWIDFTIHLDKKWTQS